MSVTGTAVLTSVRDLLQDTVAGAYRYSDESLYRALSAALFEMRRLRPDVYFDGKTIRPVPAITSSSIGEVLPVDDQFMTSLIYFTTGFAELREDQFTQDGRAITMMQAGRSVLMEL